MNENTSENFWANVDKSGECWTWIGKMWPTGYGYLYVAGHGVLAHRLSWELEHGAIPQGLYVLHRCDNRRCVRPDHLYVGTHLDNMADLRARKRSGVYLHPERRPYGQRNGAYTHPERRRWGESHGQHRLTATQVAEIRELYATGKWTQWVLARRFGMKQAQISNIVRGKSWINPIAEDAKASQTLAADEF